MSQNAKLTKPHDALFRSMMQDPQVARDFFEATLPEDLKKSVDLSTLTLQKDTFVGDDLKEQLADLVFQVKIEEEIGYFQLLVEHQSTPRWDMPLRLMKYMLAIQEHHIKHHKTQILPFVFPLLLYAGEQKYSYTMDFFKLFGKNEHRARDVFHKPFQLVDLTQMPEEQMDLYKWFGPMAFLMKEIRHLDTLSLTKKFLVKAAEFEIIDSQWYIKSTIKYIFEAGHVENPTELIQLLSNKLTSVSEEDIMTIADHFRKEGMQQGMQQGASEKSRQIALGMLQEELPLSMIRKITGLSEQEIKTLTSHS